MGRMLLRFRLNVAMAFGTLVDRPARSALTLLGIVIGILALTVMMALIGALQTSVNDALLPLGVGVFQAQREPLMGGRPPNFKEIARRKPFTLEDVEELNRRLKLTVAVGGEAWTWGTAVKSRDKTMPPSCGMAGMTPSFFDANALEIEQGRAVNATDIAQGRNVAVIGHDVVKTLFPRGAHTAIGEEIRLQNKPFTVVGTMAEKPALFGAAWRNCLVAVPISTYHQHFGKPSLHVTFIAANRHDVKAAYEEAHLTLRTMRGLKPGQADDFEMFDNESEGEELQGFAVAITAAAGAICLIALLVGGVGVMNIMLVSVMERTREIGVRKALGARPSAILAQFMTEAVVLTGLGGVVGVVIAYAIVSAGAALLSLPATVPAWTVILALASSAGVGLLAGIYPAARAAKLPPIEALRYE